MMVCMDLLKQNTKLNDAKSSLTKVAMEANVGDHSSRTQSTIGAFFYYTTTNLPQIFKQYINTTHVQYITLEQAFTKRGDGINNNYVSMHGIIVTVDHGFSVGRRCGDKMRNKT